MAVSIPAFPEFYTHEFRTVVAATHVRYANRDDMVMIELPDTATIAGVFTLNAFAAAPVKICRNHMQRATAKYLIVNSGNANAATGAQGLVAAQEILQHYAIMLGCHIEQILPFSTGVIGEQLPIEKLKRGFSLPIDWRHNAWLRATQAMMTTDTQAKAVYLRDGGVYIAGIIKGSGMIEPHMATMLGFLFTNMTVNQADLQQLLTEVVDVTFHCLTIDSDTSTNDSVMLSASNTQHISMSRFSVLLERACSQLAQMVARDGEGASKFITVQVYGEAHQQARSIGKAVANSPLVKTALFASDPNWGRIIMAVGKAGVNIDQRLVDIWINNACVVTAGMQAASYSEAIGQKLLQQEDITIDIYMRGKGTQPPSARIWTCDLSHEYVRINAEYRS